MGVANLASVIREYTGVVRQILVNPQANIDLTLTFIAITIVVMMVLTFVAFLVYSLFSRRRRVRETLFDIARTPPSRDEEVPPARRRVRRASLVIVTVTVVFLVGPATRIRPAWRRTSARRTRTRRVSRAISVPGPSGSSPKRSIPCG